MLNSNEKRKLLIESIKSGKSFNRTAKELKISKSTLYYHYKKYFGKKIVLPQFTVLQSEVEGEIVGIFAADGGACICKNGNYSITFHIGASEEDYCKRLILLLESYFHKKPYVYRRKDKNVFVIRYQSKTIYQFMKTYLLWKGTKTYSIQLKNLNLNYAFLRGFIRGYLDGDGYSDKRYKKVQINGVSGVMICQVNDIIKKLGFVTDYKIRKDLRPGCKDLHVITLKREDAEKFIFFIKPRNPVRIREWGRQDSNSRSV